MSLHLKQRHPHQSFHASQPVRLERWHRRAVYGITALLAASGLAWLALHYFLRRQGEFGDVVNPFEPWAMKLHGAAAMLGLLLYGSLILTHMRRAWRLDCNRWTGALMTLLGVLLIVSAWTLYYGADESTRPLFSALHWVPGLLLPVALLVHVRIGRRGRA